MTLSICDNPNVLEVIRLIKIIITIISISTPIILITVSIIQVAKEISGNNDNLIKNFLQDLKIDVLQQY